MSHVFILENTDGMNSRTRKLDADRVRAIRAAYARARDKVQCKKALAAKHRVHYCTIHKIVNGYRW